MYRYCFVLMFSLHQTLFWLLLKIMADQRLKTGQPHSYEKMPMLILRGISISNTLQVNFDRSIAILIIYNLTSVMQWRNERTYQKFQLTYFDTLKKSMQLFRCVKESDALIPYFVSMPDHNCDFNRTRCIDLMKRWHRTALHFVKKNTKFGAARVLTKKTRAAVWRYSQRFRFQNMMANQIR